MYCNAKFCICLAKSGRLANRCVLRVGAVHNGSGSAVARWIA